MTSMNRYPPPDWKFFIKNSARLVGVLALLHWIPEIATWIHSVVWGEQLIVNAAKFQRVLYVAYVMGGVAISIHLAGLLWSSWHNRKVKQ